MRRIIRSFLIITLLLCAAFVSHAGADELFNVLQTYLSNRKYWDFSPENALNEGRRVLQLNKIFTDSHKRYGDVYKQHQVSEPPPTCLTVGNCLWVHMESIYKAQEREFLGSYEPEQGEAQKLYEMIAKGEINELIKENLKAFRSGLHKVKPSKIRGRADAKHKVYILRNNHPLEKLQEQTLTELLLRYPQEFQFLYLAASDHPQLFRLIGTRWQAGAVYGESLVKDIVTLEQWVEAFFGANQAGALLKNRVGPRLFDAHEHVLHNGLARFQEIMADNNVKTAAIAALPKDIHYKELDAANADMLSFAKLDPQKLLPFPMLSPLDPKSAEKLVKYHQEGLRGIKLISGHGEYFALNNQEILDTPVMREVFNYCQSHKIPVLWHVNTHLYSKGFTRILEEYPKLTVVNPHFGGYLTYAPSIVKQLFERYPNLYFDISLGTDAQYLRRSFEDISSRHKEWRKLFIKFSDRFLFGVDMVVNSGTTRIHARMLYDLYRNLLETEKFDLFFVYPRGFNLFYELSQYSPALNGLALPAEVLKKLYWDNAARLYGLPG